jgi:uncharacterized membrane protein YgcG
MQATKMQARNNKADRDHCHMFWCCVAIILMLAFWWHCLKDRTTKGDFSKLNDKEDEHAVCNGMAISDGDSHVATYLPSRKHGGSGFNTVNAIGGGGGSGGGGSGTSSFL